MAALEKRIAQLEETSEARLARARAGTLPISELTDAELETLITQLDAAVGELAASIFHDLPMEDLEAISTGRWQDAHDPRVRALMEEP